MEIDLDEFGVLLVYLLQTLRQMELELLAHQIVVLNFQRMLGTGDELEQLIEQARELSALQEHIHEKYDRLLERFTECRGENSVRQEVLQFLRRCQPVKPRPQ